MITGLGVGGAEKVVLDLSKMCNPSKFKLFVLSVSDKDTLLNDFLGSDIDTTILRKKNSLVNLFPIVILVNKFIKDNNINIVHAHMSHAMIIATIVKFLNPSIKIISTSHNINIESKFREVFLFIFKKFRYLDVIFSRESNKYYCTNNIRVIPNGIQIDKYFSDLDKYNKFTFISIGRLEDQKNHSYLVEIAKKLRSTYDFEILIVGEGYLRKDLEALIKEYKVENCVKLLGLRSDTPELLNKSHCFILPSLWEGLPIVILEAGASSLPIISTPVGSIPSVLNRGNSFVCKLEDFEKNMIFIMENYKSAYAKSKILMDLLIDKHSISSVIAQHEKIYLNAIIDI